MIIGTPQSILDRQEEMKKLFQEIWTMYDDKSYEHLVSLAVDRLKLNNIDLAGKTCLDIGCGGGRFSIAMAKLGAKKVYGIDYGEESIRFARKKRNFYKLSDVFFYTGSAYNLDCCDNLFDVVVSNGVFHHLDDPEKAFKEAYRVLKPGGFFWLTWQGPSELTEAWEAARIALEDIPIKDTLNKLKASGLDIGKIYYYMDVFYAKYNCLKYEDLVKDVIKIGFVDIYKLDNIGNFNASEIRIGCYKKS